MAKIGKLALGAAVIGAALFWFLTRPDYLPQSDEFVRQGNVDNGRVVFFAGGCASCHSAPAAEGEQKLVLSGGREFPSPFGTFYAPNISSDPNFGIGNWSAQDLANAMMRGVSPEGAHYYPAFPYTSYARIDVPDVVDLSAYLATLPASDAQNVSHDIPLPFRFRRAVGLWKLLFLRDTDVARVPADLERGRYLVEGLGHCAECHTPRNIIGGLKTNAWMSGAPSPDGKGKIPNITPHANGLANWSEGDIAFYLETGFTPEFDTAGGIMVDVVENTARLSPEDRTAIARYLQAISPK